MLMARRDNSVIILSPERKLNAMLAARCTSIDADI